MKVLNGYKLFLLLMAWCCFSFKVVAIEDSSSMTVEELLAEHIVDEGLKECVSEQYESKTLLGSVLELNCNSKEIKNLAGIGLLTQLKTLYLDSKSTSFDSGIDDITELSGLNNLSFLSLNHNSNISNIDSLADLVNLTYLSLDNCFGVWNIDALMNLINLRYLSLNNNFNVNDIGALAGLSSLTNLSLDGIYFISGIDALKGLTELKTLSLQRGGE